MVPVLNAGTMLLLGDRSCSWNVFGTAAWKTKSVMSSSVLLEACIVITVTLGLVFDRSKVNSIFRPFLLYAVIEGMPVAMSLKRGCDESPSNKKGGWDICGTEAGAGAAAGAPKGNIQHEVILSQHDKAHPGNKEKIIMISG